MKSIGIPKNLTGQALEVTVQSQKTLWLDICKAKEWLFSTSEGQECLWPVNFSRGPIILADKQVHKYCSAPCVVNTCSFSCFWKNLSIQHFWRKTTWSPTLKGKPFIQFFLAYHVVTMSKWPHAKLTADLKILTLQFSTFQFLSFLKTSNSTGEWYLATSSLNNILILNHD